MSTFSIDDVAWSTPQIIETRAGARRARTWTIPNGSPFWELWKTTDLRAQGYQVRKWQGEWQVTEWRELDGEALEESAWEITEARSAHAAQVAAANVDPVLPKFMQASFDEVVKIYDAIEADTGVDYRYQLPSIKRLALAIAAHCGGLDASDTGVGKTSVACGVARTLGLDLFVVCPKAVIAPWKRMAKLFGVNARVVNYELVRGGNTAYASATTEHYIDKARKPRRRRKFAWNVAAVDPDTTMICFDDCHKMKDWKTWNCAMGVAAMQQNYCVLGASATAADNPMQMKFVALLTGLIRRADEFFGWMQQHGVRKGKWGMEFVGGRDVLTQIHHAIFPSRGSRIRVADLGDRFPSTEIIAEAYDMDDTEADTGMSIADVYAAMHREIAKLEASERKDKGACILTEQLRARQRIELLKVPTLEAMANDAIEEGMSVVVILNFEDSVQALSKRLGTPNTITGKDKPGARQRLIDRFNADDEDRIVMNIRCGGVGITLKRKPTSTPTLVLISPSYSGIDLKQALGRCHRAGGSRSIQKIVFAAGTIEEKACSKVRRKIARIDLINDAEMTSLLAGL